MLKISDCRDAKLRSGFRRFLCCAAISTALIPALVHAQTDDYADATRLYKQGNYAAASTRIDALIKTNPRDARARFLKGLILSDQGKAADAIATFQALTEDYPELPEPYNNLGVLYAAQGRYDQARGALEMAVRTHPSYAAAQENLGDIYAKMASEAYSKSLSLDKNNASAQTKLTLIRDLFSTAPARQQPLPGVSPAPKPGGAPRAAAPAS